MTPNMVAAILIGAVVLTFGVTYLLAEIEYRRNDTFE